ncbi:MAG: MazG nucleotide pyrophosphohydrolase domain-containing protein [Elusimicrobiota bacterium]
MKDKTEKLFKELINTCRRLRQKDGCMWDREQDHHTLVPFLIEEATEVKEAIEKNDTANLCEELGDLLYQIVFHSQIASENDKFSIDEVLEGINKKIIRRHPHVFSDTKVNSVDDIKKNWDRIKKEEKK